MRILLTNDDGIHAPGFAVLESIAARLSDDIWMVAPAEEQSGAGHSLTLSRPIRLRYIDFQRCRYVFQAFSIMRRRISGQAARCVAP